MIGARVSDTVRSRVAELLERGALDGRLARSVAGVMVPLALRPRVVRAPEHVRIVCVGGATLGGSGKSRVANALARAMPEAILVGHGYRARDRRARFVRPEESVEAAGDEALAAARAGLRVVIGPTRQAAVDFAAAGSDLLILDGPLAVTHPRSVSILALDADAPWGSGAVFPAGDLRAPAVELERRADLVLEVPNEIEVPADLHRPFGLFTALARPDRLVRRLSPDVVVSAPDHGPSGPLGVLALRRRLVRAAPSVTTWVATEKCATHLEDLKIPCRILRDTYMGRLDRDFLRRIVSSTDCERAGREDPRNDHRPKTGR